jgi:hypothetical protein
MMARSGTRTTPLWALPIRRLLFAMRAMVGNACQPVPNCPTPINPGSRPPCGSAPSTFSAPRNRDFTLGDCGATGHRKRGAIPIGTLVACVARGYKQLCLYGRDSGVPAGATLRDRYVGREGGGSGQLQSASLRWIPESGATQHCSYPRVGTGATREGQAFGAVGGALGGSGR